MFACAVQPCLGMTHGDCIGIPGIKFVDFKKMPPGIHLEPGRPAVGATDEPSTSAAVVAAPVEAGAGAERGRGGKSRGRGSRGGKRGAN